MVWTSFTPEGMRAVSHQLFQPCILLVNYTLLQYLMVFYWQRRREPRVGMLFAIGLLGVVCLVPFANANDAVTGGLNDVSESCCGLAFLLQITIIGRDLNKKIKFKTVLYLTWVAELLIFADVLMIFFSLACIAWPNWLGEHHESLTDDLPNVFENINLAYIFFFRFFYIIQSRGWREIVETRKLELMWYLFFATHELPFSVLEGVSGLSWESLQSVWNRVTLAGCLYVTATSKLRDRSSTQSRVENSRSKRHSRGSVGRVMARTNTVRRNSTSVYVMATRESIEQTSVIAKSAIVEDMDK